MCPCHSFLCIASLTPQDSKLCLIYTSTKSGPHIMIFAVSLTIRRITILDCNHHLPDFQHLQFPIKIGVGYESGHLASNHMIYSNVDPLTTRAQGRPSEYKLPVLSLRTQLLCNFPPDFPKLQNNKTDKKSHSFYFSIHFMVT